MQKPSSTRREEKFHLFILGIFGISDIFIAVLSVSLSLQARYRLWV
jgi:hypothetical protein